MSFGFAIGDFIAVGTLAWNLYQASRNASTEFQELGRECLSIHIAIKQTETGPDGARSLLDEKSSKDPDGLGQLSRNCRETLNQLDGIIRKYKSLGTLQKRQWDRIRFGREQLDDIRSKLTLHLIAINTFFDGVQLTMLGRIEAKIDQMALEVKGGVREPSELSMEAQDHTLHWVEDNYLWIQLKTELESEGIMSGDIENEKEAIKHYIRTLFLDEDLEDEANALKPEDSMSMMLDGTSTLPIPGGFREREDPPPLISANSTEEATSSFTNLIRSEAHRPDEDIASETRLDLDEVDNKKPDTIDRPIVNMETIDPQWSLYDLLRFKFHLLYNTSHTATTDVTNGSQKESEEQQSQALDTSSQKRPLDDTTGQDSSIQPLITEEQSPADQKSFQSFLEKFQDKKSNTSENSKKAVIEFLRRTYHFETKNMNDSEIQINAFFMVLRLGIGPAVQLMLDQGDNIDVRDVKGNTPLHLAASLGSVDIIDLLIGRNAAIDSVNSESMTPFYLAVEAGRIRVLTYFLSLPQLSPASKTNLAKWGSTDPPLERHRVTESPLQIAVTMGYEAIIELLLKYGALARRNMLDEALLAGKLGIVKLLWPSLETEVQMVDLRRQKHFLHIAIEQDNLLMVEWLISKGADIEATFLTSTVPVKRAPIGTNPSRGAVLKEGLHLAWLLRKSTTLIGLADELPLSPLQHAVSQGRVAIARTLLDQGANINKRNRRGRSLLEQAAINGDESMLRLLIEKGADTKSQISTSRSLTEAEVTVEGYGTTDDRRQDSFDTHRWTLIHFAAWGGNAKAVELLLQHIPQDNELEQHVRGQVKPASSPTPVVIAAKRGNLEIVKLLLSPVRGISDSYEQYIMSIPMAREKAAEYGQVEVLRYFLDRNLDVSRDSRPQRILATEILWTAFFKDTQCSPRGRSWEAAKLLIDYGADVNFSTTRGKCASMLHIAAAKQNNVAAQLLLKHGADPNIRDIRHQTPLHYACEVGCYAVCEELVRYRADVRAKDDHEKTPLHSLCSCKSKMTRIDKDEACRIPNLLIEHGADGRAKDRYGYTPVQRAKQSQRRDFLVDHIEKWMRHNERGYSRWTVSACSSTPPNACCD